ncbi:MAG: NAD(P)/FAD-dependent oxidoreductase [Dehalococcoidales bacterium]|nr:MAG: NAD(P)/FAD-dependent oxidoreductase [Dehalococcoidales bacterium]
MDKSIIIIGSGIAGLSTGCYGQMNGYNTRIFEMHDLPGGLCTSWKRKGYTIDGCMHFLLGSNPGTGFYRIWEELGAVQGRQIVNQDEYVRFEGEGEQVFHVYTDIDRLEHHLNELAPDDEEVIEEVIKAAYQCTRFEIPVGKARELYSLVDYIRMMPKMIPIIRFMSKWGKISTLDLANRVKHPLLRQFLLTYAEIPDYSMIVLLMAIAWHHQKQAGYAVGGSLEFARAIERRYLDLGGEINYKSKVARILVENDRAVGIQLADGTEHYSDIVISAADGRTTIFDMLEHKYINNEIQDLYDNSPLFPPLIQIALGVSRSFDEIPHLVSGINYPVEEPVTIAGQKVTRLGVHIYNYDPGSAPEGKTILKVLLNSDYDYWKELRQDTNRYREEKKIIADKVISLLEQRFPGFKDQVEMTDVATPMTWERYTGNWRASHEGWLMTTKNLNMRLRKTLPGLSNFYMAGQWVMPGGSLPYVAVSGRDVIQIICKKDKKKFVTTTP